MGLQSLISAVPQHNAFTPTARYDWQRMHAAAIDRVSIERVRFAVPRDPALRVSKRVFDVTASVALLALLSPVMLTIAVMARRDGGPAMFAHRRIGAGGESFKCWKFRTMVPDAQDALHKLLESDAAAREEWERDYKLRNDPRVTKLGRFLRTTSLDELPQLFNVLAGNMSLVGPRPIVSDEIPRYGAAFHDYARCRPGITGVWQVSGRNAVDYRHRVMMDQDYARNWSLAADVMVLLRTPLAVFRRRGAC